MKIAIVGETPSMPTGFGQQILLLVEGFTKAGHEVVLLAQSAPRPPLVIEGLTEHRFQNVHDLNELEKTIHREEPDVCLHFGCTAFVANMLKVTCAPMNVPVFTWLAYEGSYLPDDFPKTFGGTPDNTMVHLSGFGQKLWHPLVKSSLIIPHGVDLDVWKYDPDFTGEDKQALRKKWAERLEFPLWEDDLVILNTDRNIYHKRWDCTLDYIRKLQKLTNRRVVLIAHTRRVENGNKGQPAAFNIPEMVHTYGLNKRVAFTGFDWGNSLSRSDMVELFRVCDFRVSTSEGEGFGIPTIEAAAIGTPQILNEHTTTPELIGEDNPMMVESPTMEQRLGSLWAVPNTTGMAKRTIELLNNPELLDHAVEHARLRAEGLFAGNKVVTAFLELFQSAIQNNPKETLYHTFRWGYKRRAEHPSVLGDVGRVAGMLNNVPKVLEVGSFHGMFLDICSEFGLDVTGIEADPLAVAQASNRAKVKLTQLDAWDDHWPKGNIAVVTDMQDVWYNQSEELLDTMIDRLVQFDWVLIRWNPRRLWGDRECPIEPLKAKFLANDMTHRKDLEKMVLPLKHMQHEIWHRNAGMSIIPQKIARFVENQNGTKNN